MDQIALIFGLTHEKATECYVELKRAIETAISNGAIEKVVRTRHDPGLEQPPSCIFTFVDGKIRGNCRKPMSKINLKKEIDEVIRGGSHDRQLSMADVGMTQDPAFLSVMTLPEQPTTQPARAQQQPTTQQPANSPQPQTQQQTNTQPQQQAVTQQHAGEPNSQRLPSIHELHPFEPQSHVFNLPGKYSIRFGPASIIPASSATNGQHMITGGQPQQLQQPVVTGGPQVPDNNDNRNTAISGTTRSTGTGTATGPDPLRVESLQTTASLALSASASGSGSASNSRASQGVNRGPNVGASSTTAVGQVKTEKTMGSAVPASASASVSASNIRPSQVVNRGPNAEAGSSTAAGQARTGNASSSTVPAVGQFRGSKAAQSSKDKGKRVRTESETESEEDIYS